MIVFSFDTRLHRGKRTKFLVSKSVHPQTIAVVKTRADVLNTQILEINGTIDTS